MPSFVIFLLVFIFLAVTTLAMLPFINPDLAIRLQFWLQESLRDLEKEIEDLEREAERDKNND